MDKLQELMRKIAENPTADLYCKRGEFYYYQAKYNEALDDCNKAIELNPDLAMAYNNRGALYSDLNKYNEALNDYNKAIELNPDLANAYYNRGDLYHYTLKEHEKVLDDYKKVCDLCKEKDAYWKERARNRIIEIENILKNEKLCENEQDVARKVLGQTEKFSKDIDDMKESQKEFYSHTHIGQKSDEFELNVLRKWNSFTPIIGNASKGGGYFIKYKGKGIVIDPGFNFIENFINAGYKMADIDVVMITHAHNDHTADLESLLTLHYKYNDDLFGSAEEEKKGSIYDKVLENKQYSRKDLTLEKRKEVDEEVNKIFKKERKELAFYVTVGTLAKYSRFFDFNKGKNYKVICVDNENSANISIGDFKIRVIKAKHSDLISDYSSVGFCFELDDFALVYTGDTGFGDDEIQNAYKDLKADYKNKKILLIANLGGFKDRENAYSGLDEDVEKDKDCYYKEHLGRIGLAKLCEVLKPEVCVISEFGEEFKNHRIKVAETFDEVFAEAYKNYKNNEDVRAKLDFKTKFLPADIGLRLKYSKDGEIKVLAITDANFLPASSDERDDLTDSDGFKRKFIAPEDALADEVYQISQLYYYKKGVDANVLGKKKTSKFYESLNKG